MTCKACGLEHRGWVSCAKARADSMKPVQTFEQSSPLDELIEQAWNETPKVELVANGEPVANAFTNAVANRYKDKEKRRAYMRELMRKRRAQAPNP